MPKTFCGDNGVSIRWDTEKISSFSTSCPDFFFKHCAKAVTMSNSDHPLIPYPLLPLRHADTLRVHLLGFSFCAYSWILFSFLKSDVSKCFITQTLTGLLCLLVQYTLLSCKEFWNKTSLNHTGKLFFIYFIELIGISHFKKIEANNYKKQKKSLIHLLIL